MAINKKPAVPVADKSDVAKRIAAALKAAGFDSKSDWDTVIVNGHKFEVERYGNIQNAVLFLESSFKVEEDGSFDISRALGLVIKELPKRIAAAEERASLFRNRVAARKLASGESDYASGYTYPTDVPGVTLDASSRGVVVRFVGSPEEAARVLEVLRGAVNVNEAS